MKTAENSEKKYKVCRYFDNYFEATIATGLTYDEAKVIRENKNSLPQRVYVSYEIVELKD